MTEICVKCGQEAPPDWVDPPTCLEGVEELDCPGGCVWALKKRAEEDSDD